MNIQLIIAWVLLGVFGIGAIRAFMVKGKVLGFNKGIIGVLMLVVTFGALMQTGILISYGLNPLFGTLVVD